MSGGMIKFISRKEKDYSRYNIIRQFSLNIKTKNNVYILLPFSKNQFFKNFFKRNFLINDFFISNYDTYVYDRKKIGKFNPRSWWKYFQDWFNFKFSKYLISDTQNHFNYWNKLFGKFYGHHYVIPVLADRSIYYPLDRPIKNKAPKILFYGSFIPLHGIDVILKALAILEEEPLKYSAEIVGTGQTYKKMKELHKHLNLKNVIMKGEFIEENQLAQKIRTSDIILGIFGDSMKAKSVIPNKVYQASACGKCTVTMKSDTVIEFYDESQLVLCDNNPQDLAHKLIELLTNPEKIDQYGQLAYEQFDFIYKNAQKEFIDLIKEVDRKTSGFTK